MILIISDPEDATARLVLSVLRAEGVDVLCWDEGWYPARDKLTATFSGSGARPLLRTGGKTYDLSAVTAVWDRRPSPLTIAEQVTDPSHRELSRLVARTFLDGFWTLLPARWMPGPPTRAMLANTKPVHLARAAELGFTIPDTVITNDPDELVPAWTAAGGRLITKTITYRDLRRDGERLHTYTTVVHRRHLARRHRLRYAPAILQPAVPKQAELRVTVIGDEVFAARIDSQSSRLTAQDWRHYDGQRVPYLPDELPAAEAERCRALVASLGLSFGAIDLILTPDGQYVFLEVNVNGEWGWVEAATGLPMARAVADWLRADEP